MRELSHACLGAIVGVSVSILLSSLATSPWLGFAEGGAPSENPVIETAAFLGWHDDFNDTSKVASSSGVEISEGTVQLRLAVLTRQGLVLSWGSSGAFDSSELGAPSVLLDGTVYKMWYYGSSGFDFRIGYATSLDGRTWTKQGQVLAPSLPLEDSNVAYPEVLKIGSEYRMWYTGYDGTTYRIFAATSSDGISWTKQGVTLDVGPPGALDDFRVWDPTVIVRQGAYYMWYTGQSTSDPPRARIMLATSADGLSWTKQGVVLSPGPAGSRDEDYAANPAVRIVGPLYEMIYMGGSGGVQRLLYARSVDGVNWQKRGLALDLLAPEESPYVNQPSFLIEANGSFSVYYAARGSGLRIYYAMLPPPSSGRVVSTAIEIPSGLRWGSFEQNVSVPPMASIRFTVRDARSHVSVPGLENRSPERIDLGALDPLVYPRLSLEASLFGGESGSPVLDSWQVAWSVPSLPRDGGFAITGLYVWLLIGGLVATTAAAITFAILFIRSRRE